jgi:cytosine deaminase
VAPGFVETHIHLDKSRISDRCTIREGTLQEAIAETARAKGAFTEEDIVARARRTLEQADPQRHHAHAHPRGGRSPHRAEGAPRHRSA